jgi:hypothetical protein
VAGWSYFIPSLPGKPPQIGRRFRRQVNWELADIWRMILADIDFQVILAMKLAETSGKLMVN